MGTLGWKMNKKKSYRNIKCDLCGKNLNSPTDNIIYNTDGDTITELSFRHAGICDDKRYYMSRPVMRDYSDLLDRWARSPYNSNNFI